MKRNKKHENRVKKLIVACGLCAVILTVSTYAWFIGMKTVNVSAFNVEIAAIDGLSLSLTGESNSWKSTVAIDKDSFDTYSGNTNSWGGKKGLIPMSSVGVIDASSSRLKLYEKGSFTATAGGYRIMSSRVQNTGASEADGYVAFDLFIKNLSGNEYYTEVNEKNEEAIYLTPESEVKVAATGNNEENSGIENSVRVAFAQIGRVKADSAASKIQGISCAEGQDGVSVICGRTAQIWEPNDTKHVNNAIKWYETSCKGRTGDDVMDPNSYSGVCGTVTNGVAVPTYAVSGVIKEVDKVDAYDGAEFNGYGGSTSATPADGKLMKFPYFTDSDKHKEGVERPKFITLAPNSVTKVRIYVYLEGQDVDNYDFASLGKKISVAFGFTKERYYGDDIDYNTEDPKGPTLPEGLQTRPATATVTP